MKSITASCGPLDWRRKTVPPLIFSFAACSYRSANAIRWHWTRQNAIDNFFGWLTKTFDGTHTTCNSITQLQLDGYTHAHTHIHIMAGLGGLWVALVDRLTSFLSHSHRHAYSVSIQLWMNVYAHAFIELANKMASNNNGTQENFCPQTLDYSRPKHSRMRRTTASMYRRCGLIMWLTWQKVVTITKGKLFCSRVNCFGMRIMCGNAANRTMQCCWWQRTKQ